MVGKTEVAAGVVVAEALAVVVEAATRGRHVNPLPCCCAEGVLASVWIS